MAIKFRVSKADLAFESSFGRPEFGLFRDTHGLLDHLFDRLQPHGLRLADVKIETGGGTAADFHVLCYLFNFLMAIRIRLDRIDVYCSDLPQDYVQTYGSAIVDTLTAVRTHLPDLSFRSHALAVGLHGVLEGQPITEYLFRFAANVPKGLGPPIGNGVVFYFGPEEDQSLSTLTVDMSAVVPDALYVRTHVVWDANKVNFEAIQRLGETFVREAVSRLGLELQ